MGQEVQYLRDCLPEQLIVHRLNERLSALGNIIACNDYVALINPDVQRETEEILNDVLCVDAFRQNVTGHSIVGSYCCFSNQGGIVHPQTTTEDLEDLSSLLQIPLVAGTVN